MAVFESREDGSTAVGAAGYLWIAGLQVLHGKASSPQALAEAIRYMGAVFDLLREHGRSEGDMVALLMHKELTPDVDQGISGLMDGLPSKELRNRFHFRLPGVELMPLFVTELLPPGAGTKML